MMEVDVIYLEGQSEKRRPHAWLNLKTVYYLCANIAKRLIKKTLTQATYEKNLKV